MAILVEIGQAVRPGRVMKEPKEKKARKETHSGKLLTQRYVVLHAGWSSRGSYKFQVSSKSDEPFLRYGGSKFAISYT